MKDKALPALFDDPAHPLAAPLTAWGAASPRFAAFLHEHRDKIRKKARGAREPETQGDLLFELAVARDLHRERYGTLGYERHLPDRTRVPDFALTVPSGAIVIIEVTRLRPLAAGTSEESDDAAPRRANAPPPIDLRLAALVCGKLSQLVPNVPNVIVAGVPGELLPTLNVAEAMRALLARAERRELTPREQHYIRKPSDFFRGFRALSGLLVRPWPPPVSVPSATLWINGQSPKTLPTRLRTYLADVPAEEPVSV